MCTRIVIRAAMLVTRPLVILIDSLMARLLAVVSCCWIHYLLKMNYKKCPLRLGLVLKTIFVIRMNLNMTRSDQKMQSVFSTQKTVTKNNQ